MPLQIEAKGCTNRLNMQKTVGLSDFESKERKNSDL